MADGVKVTLGGQEVTLRPLFGAFKTCNALGDGSGFSGTFRRVIAMDAEIITAVIAAGLGKKISDVEKDVFEAGLTTLTAPVSQFLTMLANGGKAIADEGEGPKQGE